MADATNMKFKADLENEKFVRATQEMKDQIKDFSRVSTDAMGAFGNALGINLNKIASLKTAGMAAFASLGAAVGKFCSDAVSMTQTWGDMWEETTSGLSHAYGQFVRQLSSGEGWDNLFSNMAKAYQAGVELAQALDSIFEFQMSDSYAIAQLELEIAQLENIRKDTSKSAKEREAATRSILDKEDQINKLRKDTAQRTADAYKNDILKVTGMSPAEYKDMVQGFRDNRDIIEAAQSYIDKKAQFDNALAMMDQGSKGYRETKQALVQLEAETSGAVKNWGATLQKYAKGNDDLIRKVVESEVAVVQIDTETARRKGKALKTLGGLTASSSGSSINWQSEAANAAREAAEVAAADAEFAATADAWLEEFRAAHNLTGSWTREISKLANDAEFNAILDGSVLDIMSSMEDFEVPMDGINGFLDEMSSAVDRAQALSADFANAVTSGFSSGMQVLMDSLMGLDELNGGAIMQALLSPLADLAIKEGEIVMAAGIANTALFASLTDPSKAPLAIAAGAALIAVGSAAKSGLSALANSYGASSSSVASGGYSTASSGKYDSSEVKVVVTGELRGQGSQLVAVIENENKRTNRTT